MTQTTPRPGDFAFHRAQGTQLWADEVAAAAHASGYSLRQLELDTGQLVWMWHDRGDPGPRFLTRRVALAWMADLLEHADRHGL
jgi:hypothetical protein